MRKLTSGSLALAAIFAFALQVGGANVVKADELDDIKKAGVIKVGYFEDFPPFSSADVNLESQGYDIDVINALEEFRSEAGAARNCYIGNLAVGIVDNLINNPSSKLHQAIARMNELAPELQISVHVVSPTEIEQGVLESRFDLGPGACGRHSPYLSYHDLFDELQVLYCGSGHPLFDRSRMIAISDLKNQQFARRAYPAPDYFPTGIKLPSTAVADLMESVAVFILSGRYVGFLPEHLARQWVAQGLMRPLLKQTLSYKNPIYLAIRKTEQEKPILSAFLDALYLAHGLDIAERPSAAPTAKAPDADKPGNPSKEMAST